MICLLQVTGLVDLMTPLLTVDNTFNIQRSVQEPVEIHLFALISADQIRGILTSSSSAGVAKTVLSARRGTSS